MINLSDAFSHSQITSKIWLCEKLETHIQSSCLTRIYGGWCGIAAFLLLSRGAFKVSRIESVDIDPECEVYANMINEKWVNEGWKFIAKTGDCNTICSKDADLVINTSAEHFASVDWWHRISTGTRVAIQSNNMQHDDHFNTVNSLDEMLELYPVTQLLYSGSIEFEYSELQFTRFMIIGIK